MITGSSYWCPRCGWYPFFEPRAVASVPRTVEWFRSLLSFRHVEYSVSDTVRGTLATARGSRNGGAAERPADGRTVQITSVRPTTSLRFKAPSASRSLPLAVLLLTRPLVRHRRRQLSTDLCLSTMIRGHSSSARSRSSTAESSRVDVSPVDASPEAIDLRSRRMILPERVFGS